MLILFIVFLWSEPVLVVAFEVIACTPKHPLILMLILYLKQSLGIDCRLLI